MPAFLPPVRFTGAQVLRDGALQRRSLAVAEARITKGPLPEVDMTGYLILPGIVDLHGRVFEDHILPRPGSPLDLHSGIATTAQDAAANGITTAWLAQGWSREGGIRGPDFAEDLLHALATYRSVNRGTDIRVQFRCQTHFVDSADRLLAAIATHGVDYVIFNNHFNNSAKPSEIKLQKASDIIHGQAPPQSSHTGMMPSAQLHGQSIPRHLCRLAEAFDDMGVTYGSHQDPDGETRERFSMIGATVAEFPISRKAAAAARAMNDPVLLSAPTVIRNEPAETLDAVSMIEQGLCTALASDDQYHSLADAAWHLVDIGLCDLPQAWAMISTRPAEIMQLPDRGILDYGRRADLTAINAGTRQVEMTMAGGALTYLAPNVAERIVANVATRSLAAE